MTQLPEDIRAKTLDHRMRAWARRLGWRRGLARSGRTLILGSLMLGAFIAAACWIPVPGGPEPVVGIVAAMVALGALLSALATRFDRAEAAQIADLVLGTRALFVTAEGALRHLEQGDPISEAERACLERAAEQAATLNPSQVAPFGFGARWLTLLLPVALTAAALFAPFAIDARKIEDDKSLAEALEKLEEVEKRQRTPSVDPDDDEIKRGMRRLIKRLQKGELTRTEALEELGEIKRKLRAEELRRAERASQAAKAAAAAARELGRSQGTSAIARRMAEGARSRSDQTREQAAKQAAEEVRKLNSLDRQARQQAADRLDKAAEAAEAAGDHQLAEALRNTAQAAREGDEAKLTEAAGQLQQAMRRGQQNTGDLEELAQGLEQAQQALGQQGQRMANNQQQGLGGGQGQSGDESRIAPAPRNWQEGLGPGHGLGDSQGAGQGHQDEEAQGKEITEGHQDANRFGDETPEESEIDYQELYEAFLLNTGDRISTRVQGERGDSGKIDTMRGGQQAPRTEQAQRALRRLPLQYADEVDKAIGEETIPPAYRDAVRDYFDR